MFFKIPVLKNFAMTVKKTPVLACLFNRFSGLYTWIFIKKRLLHRCFLKKILRTDFFVEHLAVHCNLSKFYVMIESFGRLWVQNWHFSCFLCHSFDFAYGCFHNKIFSKCKFLAHYNLSSSTILTESLKVQTPNCSEFSQ